MHDQPAACPPPARRRAAPHRHFPDDDSIVVACSAHWSADHPLPDPAGWAGLEDPEERLRTALTALYEYYREGEPMLEQVLRDEDEVEALARVMVPFHEYTHELAGSLAAGWGVRGEAQRRLRAAVGHAVRFSTWRSLAAEGLDNREVVELMVRFVSELAEGRKTHSVADA